MASDGVNTSKHAAQKMKDEFKNGDLIFQTSLSSQSRPIQIATKSKYSHCGIIFMQNKEYYVFEALQPVKYTKLDDWIKRGQNQQFVVKRLKNAGSAFTDDKIDIIELFENKK